MRSTTVGWLTSIVRVLPVTADHIWLNSARPEFRDSISHPMDPTKITPRNSPTPSANTTGARGRTDLGGGGTAGSLAMSQGYHSEAADPLSNCCWLESQETRRDR